MFTSLSSCLQGKAGDPDWMISTGRARSAHLFKITHLPHPLGDDNFFRIRYADECCDYSIQGLFSDG